MKLAGYPEEYIQFLAEYHGSRDFFECHEVMEEYWKSQPHTRYTGCWLVLIRISVAYYHARRANWSGARKMMTKAAAEIDGKRMSELGLDGDRLVEQIAEAARKWSSSSDPVYEQLEIPIADPELLRLSQQYCMERGWSWGRGVEDTEDEVIHKHLRRDRTEVIEARSRSANLKKNRSEIPRSGS